MLKQLFQEIQGTLAADISSTTTLIPVDLDTLTELQTVVNFSGGEWTYLLLFDGVVYEEVKVTDTTGEYLIVQRGTSGSTPQVFSSLSTTLSTSFGRDAINDVVAENPVPVDFTVSGSGLAEVERVANDVTVHVDSPNFTGSGGIKVLGQWPDVEFAIEIDSGGCCPDVGGGEGATEITLAISSEILSGSYSGGVLSLALQTPVFNAVGGVVVTGEWPNFTIDTSLVGGGAGTVTGIAAGDGLTITGNPAINPTLSITNTGVVPGDYAGLVINARGQIDNVPVDFAPISEIVFADGAALVSRLAGVVTVTMAAADIGSAGMVALADPSAPVDPLDETSAVTPAMLASALGTDLGSAAGTDSGEPDASYTNIISNTAVAVDLAAGETALLIGEVVVLDGTTPLTPVAYGVAVFDAGSVKRYSSKILTQSKQVLLGYITGPLTSSLSITTTALPAGSALQGARLAVLKL